MPHVKFDEDARCQCEHSLRDHLKSRGEIKSCLVGGCLCSRFRVKVTENIVDGVATRESIVVDAIRKALCQQALEAIDRLNAPRPAVITVYDILYRGARER